MKGLTHEREPMPNWSPFNPETYGSEHPGQRCSPVTQPDGVTGAADEVFQSEEHVLTPGLADLFEALGVIRSAAHAIKVLWNKRVIGLRQGEPVDRLVAVVFRVRAYSQSDLRPDGRIKLHYVLDISDDNIRAGHKVWHSRPTACCMGGMTIDFVSPLNKLVDLDRLHRRADGNCSGQ